MLSYKPQSAAGRSRDGRPCCGLDGARNRRRRQVRQLHHNGRQAGVAALCMHLPAGDKRPLPDAESLGHSVPTADPATARYSREELPEARFVGPNGATGLDPDAIDMSFAPALTKLERIRPVALVGQDCYAVTGRKIE